MRFKASIHNISTFTKFAGALATIGPIAWVRLNDHEVRFTIIPEHGSQVWAVLQIDTIFETYTIQSAAESNTINLEVPVAQLHKALRSALQATSASIRLTKKDNIPLLSLTIATTIPTNGPGLPSTFDPNGHANGHSHGDRESSMDISNEEARDRETIITQDVPVRVLSEQNVEGLHEPRCRDPDVHILLPPLMQLKSISDRFTKVALATRTSAGHHAAPGLTTSLGPRLEMAANAHGCLKVSIRTDAMNISSLWTGLTNPDIVLETGGDGREGEDEDADVHPSVRMKELGDKEGRSDEGWARVRIDGKDWGKVLSVGRLGGRVIACFCDEHAMILYVYLPNEEDGPESVLTVRVPDQHLRDIQSLG